MQVVQNPDIIASAKIIERLNDRIFKAELPNGKLIHIHFSKSDESELKIEIGDLVKVKMNPFDFSRGRIIPSWIRLDAIDGIKKVNGIYLFKNRKNKYNQIKTN